MPVRPGCWSAPLPVDAGIATGCPGRGGNRCHPAVADCRRLAECAFAGDGRLGLRAVELAQHSSALPLGDKTAIVPCPATTGLSAGARIRPPGRVCSPALRPDCVECAGCTSVAPPPATLRRRSFCRDQPPCPRRNRPESARALPHCDAEDESDTPSRPVYRRPSRRPGLGCWGSRYRPCSPSVAGTPRHAGPDTRRPLRPVCAATRLASKRLASPSRLSVPAEWAALFASAHHSRSAWCEPPPSRALPGDGRWRHIDPAPRRGAFPGFSVHRLDSETPPPRSAESPPPVGRGYRSEERRVGKERR